MNWTPHCTRVELAQNPLCSHDIEFMTLGSCFSEHIGQRLLDYKWQGMCNPFGTLFHPLSIFELLRLSLSEQELRADGFVEYDETVFHFDLPKLFFAETPEKLQAKFAEVGRAVRSHLQAPSCLFVTLGTAQVFEDQQTGALVANCHSQNPARFRKRLLRLEEIEAAWQELSKLLGESHQVIWTLSPVRHVRETLTQNAVSKSLLRVWLHERIAAAKGREHYFPAFEIMVDQLRDYRYYAEDLIHPNAVAVDCLWEAFLFSFVDARAQDFCRVWSKLRKRLQHRPLRPEAQSSVAFLQETLKQLQALKGVDVSDEIALVQDQLSCSGS